MEKIQKSYYAIIPANVRYDKDLTPNAKLLYGEITALCNEKGYCWASNSYFARLYTVSKETTSRWISKLESLGYIKTKLIYAEGTKSVQERRIYINNVPIDENINRYRQNNQYPIDEIINTPIDENVKDNNTVFNNTINNTGNRDKTTATLTKENMESIIKEWNQLGLQELKAIRVNTNRYKMLKARLKEYSFPEIVQAIQGISKSPFLKGQNDRGWIITFDWFIRPNNFLKVLEGNYIDDKKTPLKSQNNSPGSNKSKLESDHNYNMDDLEKMLLNRSKPK